MPNPRKIILALLIVGSLVIVGSGCASVSHFFGHGGTPAPKPSHNPFTNPLVSTEALLEIAKRASVAAIFLAVPIGILNKKWGMAFIVSGLADLLLAIFLQIALPLVAWLLAMAGVLIVVWAVIWLVKEIHNHRNILADLKSAIAKAPEAVEAIKDQLHPLSPAQTILPGVGSSAS